MDELLRRHCWRTGPRWAVSQAKAFRYAAIAATLLSKEVAVHNAAGFNPEEPKHFLNRIQ